ncbi:proton-conducting transporter membrane subunit [Thiomonas sp.]|uniref:proton-conducting transporter transmembrane domain-containing protein n=1 Tax=Thiomonas sp. TaxID=2047785 RepID=UPI002603B221|nr:proton-conducting transporter membrane subunit [Thiomonas sp.]
MIWNVLYTIWAVTAVAMAGSWVSRHARVAEGLNLAAAIIDFILVCVLLAATPPQGATALQGYLLLDDFGVWVMFCLAVVYLLASVYAIGYMRWMHGEQARLHRFYSLFAAFALTMFLAPAQNNPGLYWIAIDLTTIVSAFLVGFRRAPESIEAAWKYIVIVSAGLGLALLGTVLFYWAGTFVLGPVYDMTWANLAAIAPKAEPLLLLLSFLLVLVGFGTKVGLAPMHTWLPDAHSEGPAPVSAMLSGALLNCAMLGIVRYLQIIAHTSTETTARTALVVLGAFSLLVAALFISRQTIVKRLAAYSSVEHMGVIALGFGFGGPLGVIGALYHMLNHSLTKSLVFFGAGNMMHAYESKEIDRIRRVMRFFPRSGAVWLAGAVAITGAPPFGLFLSELTILRGGMQSANPWAVWWMGVLLIVIFIGFLNKFRAMYFGPRPEHAPHLKLRFVHVAPMAVALAAVLWLGLWWLPPLWNHLAAIAAQLGGV